MAKVRIVDCYGDALTFGTRSTRGWPEHLWGQLHAEGKAVVVRNRGLPGHAKAQDVLRAINASDDRGDIAILACPAYDAYGSGTPPREYQALLSQAFFGLSQRYDLVLGCTPTPVMAHPGQPRSFGRQSRRWFKNGARAAAEAMEDQEIKIIGISDIHENLLADGIHPTPEGYRWIAAEVAKKLSL